MTILAVSNRHSTRRHAAAPGTCGYQPRIIPTYVIAIYAPMIYTAPFIMFWMRAYLLRGQLGGGWALEIESFLGLVKWH